MIYRAYRNKAQTGFASDAGGTTHLGKLGPTRARIRLGSDAPLSRIGKTDDREWLPVTPTLSIRKWK